MSVVYPIVSGTAIQGHGNHGNIKLLQDTYMVPINKLSIKSSY